MNTIAEIRNLRTYAHLINDSGYFAPVTVANLEGVKCYGIYGKDTSELLGGVLVVAQGAHAYLDYLVVSKDCQSQGLSVRLLDGVRVLLEQQGVKYVYACVNGGNTVASALIRRYPNAVGFPYFHVHVQLGD